MEIVMTWPLITNISRKNIRGDILGEISWGGYVKSPMKKENTFSGYIIVSDEAYNELRDWISRGCRENNGRLTNRDDIYVWHSKKYQRPIGIELSCLLDENETEGSSELRFVIKSNFAGGEWCVYPLHNIITLSTAMRLIYGDAILSSSLIDTESGYTGLLVIPDILYREYYSLFHPWERRPIELVERKDYFDRIEALDPYIKLAEDIQQWIAPYTDTKIYVWGDKGYTYVSDVQLEETKSLNLDGNIFIPDPGDNVLLEVVTEDRNYSVPITNIVSLSDFLLPLIHNEIQEELIVDDGWE